MNTPIVPYEKLLISEPVFSNPYKTTQFVFQLSQA